MKKSVTLIALIAIGFFSCEERNEDVVKQPNKDGSIETTITVTHSKDYDVLTTTHKVWVKNIIQKTLIKNDTIPNLGFTVQEGENSEGETKMISVPKDYEFYITVK